MKKLLVISAFILSIQVYGQEPARIFNDTTNESSFISIGLFNTYSSNRFDNEFMDKFIFGGEITQEIKDRNSGRLKLVNAIGAEFEQRIDSYSPDINLFKKEDLGMKLTFSDNHYASLNLSQDLFNIGMYGNAGYVGDTMDMTFSSVQYQHYQKFGVGFYNQHNFSSIQLNYIAGSKSFKGILNESWMYTQNNLDTIDFMLGGEAFVSERFYPYWAFRGSGFSIDIDYNFIFQGKVKNRQVINFKMNNLGIIFWNRNSKNYTISTQDHYAGFDIQDLLNQDTTQSSIDWMDTLNVQETIGNRIDVLPMELVVQKLADQGIDQKWQSIFGFKAIMVPNYFPYLFAGAYYKTTENISMSSRVSYGGFAGFRWGYNFNYWLKDKLFFSAGTFDIIGLISKKYGFGRGFNFSMSFKI